MSVDLSHLNPEQRAAVEHFEGPLLVLAGAGSGKTRVLTTRIAHLVDELGVDPAGILSVTFTNKAAGEMRERIRGLLGRDPVGMWMGTFHAIGVRMLRRHATRLGWTPNFLIYDAEDAERLIRRILRDELQLDPKRWNPKGVHHAISAAKNELIAPQAYTEGALDPFARKVAEVYGRYQRALSEANAFDFDDLLVKPVELLRGHPDVAQIYADRFRFVLVDEYQDTNHAQYIFLKLVAEEHGNLFVVGDDDQSIYGWRGADLRNILDFEKDFPEAKVVRLEQNYRSTQTILGAANRVISENLRRKGKTLRTDNPAGERLTLVETADERDESEWIVAELRARQADEAELANRDFVVLYRTNSQSRALEEVLLREGVPYRIIGGTRFYERREIKDALAYLRLVANPADDQAFLRIVNVPRRGIGDTTVARLAEWASEQRLPLLRAALEAGSAPGIRGAAGSALAGLAGTVGKFAALAGREVALDHLLRGLLNETGLVESLRDEGSEAADRIGNLEELVASAADLQSRLDAGDPELLSEWEEMENEDPSPLPSPEAEAAQEGRGEGNGEEDSRLRPVDVFLSHVSLIAELDPREAAQADAVALMTLHNAKGLEFPVVFLAGMEEGLFPLARVYDEPEELEEERRLFYVGITRAKRKLYLTLARRRRRGGSWMDSAPSSFLEAVPKELLESRKSPRIEERFATLQRPWRSADGGFGRFGAGAGLRSRSQRLGLDPSPPAPANSDDSGYQVDYADTQDLPQLVKGARVRHPQFGAGTVAELSGVGADVRATIDFDAAGRKKVVVRYANLQADWE